MTKKLPPFKKWECNNKSCNNTVGARYAIPAKTICPKCRDGYFVQVTEGGEHS